MRQTEAEEVFGNEPLLLLADAGHSGEGARVHAYGRSDDGRLLHVRFALRTRGTLIRVISARPTGRGFERALSSSERRIHRSG